MVQFDLQPCLPRPPGDLQDFVFLGDLFPTPRHVGRASPTPDRPHISFIGASF